MKTLIAERQLIIKSIWKEFSKNENERIKQLKNKFKQRHLPCIVFSSEFHKKWTVSPTVDEILKIKHYDDPAAAANWDDILS